MRRLLTALACAALVCAPASAQVMKLHPAPASGTVVIGTPVSLGTESVATANPVVLPISHDATAGAFIGVIVVIGGGRTAPVCSDSKANTYTAALVTVVGGNFHWFCWSVNPTTPLTVGGSDTISVAYSGSTDQPVISAFQVSGLSTTSPFDVTGTPASGTGTTVSPVQTTTTGANNEIVITDVVTGGSAGTYATDTGHGFANVNKNQQAGGGSGLFIDYKIVAASGTTVSNAPTWASSSGYVASSWTFKQ